MQDIPKRVHLSKKPDDENFQEYSTSFINIKNIYKRLVISSLDP